MARRTFLSYWLSPIRQCSGERRAIHKSRISAIMKRFMISSNLIRNLKRSSDAIRRHVFWFVLFLLSLPFSIRKVFAVFTADGTFNEYLDVSLYLSDVLLCITLILYILENKSYILSISYWRKMFHVEHLLLPIFIPAFFIFWSGLSIFWSESLSLAWFTFLRLIEGFLLYLYILMQNVPRGTLSPQPAKCSTWNILQFYLCHSSQMFHVEHCIQEQPNVPRGTSCIYMGVQGGNFRSIAGTFLQLFKICYSSFHYWAYNSLFQYSKNVPRGTFTTKPAKCSTWNI